MTPSVPFAAWVRTAASELAPPLLDLLLPATCAACGAPGRAPFCAACLHDCRPPAGPCCRRCGAPWTRARAGGHPCGRCLRFGRPFAFDTAVGLWRYRGPVRQLVHAFKYRGRQDLLEPCGRLIARHARTAGVVRAQPPPLVVPVPARRASLARRGYNQAEGLAAGLARELHLPLDTRALRRRRDTGPQTARSGRQRRLQAAAAFRARSPRVHARSILLIDDVLSTGATADAATRALRLAGAARVLVAALAT